MLELVEITKNFTNNGQQQAGYSWDQFWHLFNLFKQFKKHEVIYTNVSCNAAGDCAAGSFMVIRPKNADENPAGARWTLILAYIHDTDIANYTDTPLGSDMGGVFARLAWEKVWDEDNQEFNLNVPVTPWVKWHAGAATGGAPVVATTHMWEWEGALAFTTFFSGGDRGYKGVAYVGRFDPVGEVQVANPVILVSTGNDFNAWGGARYSEWADNPSYAPSYTGDDWVDCRLGCSSGTFPHISFEKIQLSYYENNGTGRPFLRPIHIATANDDGKFILGFLPTQKNSLGRFEGLFDARYLGDSSGNDTGDRVVFCGTSFPW